MAGLILRIHGDTCVETCIAKCKCFWPVQDRLILNNDNIHGEECVWSSVAIESLVLRCARELVLHCHMQLFQALMRSNLQGVAVTMDGPLWKLA